MGNVAIDTVASFKSSQFNISKRLSLRKTTISDTFFEVDEILVATTSTLLLNVVIGEAVIIENTDDTNYITVQDSVGNNLSRVAPNSFVILQGAVNLYAIANTASCRVIVYTTDALQ